MTAQFDPQLHDDWKDPPPMLDQLKWKKYPVLNDGFICLVDAMGDDYAIIQAARKSYDKDLQDAGLWQGASDRNTLRFMMRLGHTSPFEMVELKFLVRVPMDCWRQWIRHRTASVNEYSTRYTEAIDSQQITSESEWRLQASDNKQGSGGYLTRTVSDLFREVTDYTEVFDRVEIPESNTPIGKVLSELETQHHTRAKRLYEQRLAVGVAKEQARKDLPLSTYTEAYWKCDLHNIFNFLRLRMDSHAQLEIRSYANAMAEIVKQIVPVAWEAFEDYVLHAKKFSRMEMELLNRVIREWERDSSNTKQHLPHPSMTDREWKEFLQKIS